MEDTRIALKEGTLLSVSNREKGAVTYTIGKVKGRGMSGIVYDASYLDNRGYRHAVLIKECYPFEADIYRDGDRLVPGSELDEGFSGSAGAKWKPPTACTTSCSIPTA